MDKANASRQLQKIAVGGGGAPLLQSFEQRWQAGEAVVVSGLDKHLKLQWTPTAFLQKFGAEAVQMVDCCDGSNIDNYTLAHFFRGYLFEGERLLCKETKQQLILKLR